ncbi:MAG: hypothetical protein U5L96_10160 [Owenweeksia sp.]|nr:hypothetical protein [Owenweeksia sp.]
MASRHDENSVFAVFNNHKNGDFKPYILKSENRGTSWTNISGDLPKEGSVYTIAQDHENKDLLFAGTEFGVFFTVDGGKHWQQLKAGLPTIAIRDIAIQRRENDLVLASFGRGIYVLDDYSPLRVINENLLRKKSHLFNIKDGLVFMEAQPLGYGKKGFQGASYYAADNPPDGGGDHLSPKGSAPILKSAATGKKKRWPKMMAASSTRASRNCEPKIVRKKATCSLSSKMSRERK